MRLSEAFLLILVVAAGAGGYHMRPRKLHLTPQTRVPICELDGGSMAVRTPGAELVAKVYEFNDELYAYMMFDYLRSARAARGAEVLLTHEEQAAGPACAIVLRLENDLLQAIPFLAGLEAAHYIPDFEWRFTSPEDVRNQRLQTRVFVAAYNLPVRKRLENLTPAQVTDYVRRFLLFKSRTDPRVLRAASDERPEVLSPQQAHRLASDLITVADFFWLPLEFFLGIGAMENNYMDVRGDLEHAVWKRRAEKGDIVLRRRRGRVLVLNYATGVWQITRETLRHAHKLYLKSKWDYSLLPQRLQPPRDLNLEEIDPAHLTTYAGLLFRDLLDRFQGDVPKAVGAYNGGPGNPNLHYEEGVRLVASYARRMLEQAARLNGQAVADMRFLAPAR